MNGERNTELLCLMALKLKPLLSQLTFVGGCTTALHITDRAAADVRATDDVDAVADVTTVFGYQRLGSSLRKLGFREDVETGVICRWRFENMSLDVVPVSPAILGFGNYWYAEAIGAARLHRLQASLAIRLAPAPYFLATKLCAFHDRGNEDFMASHDIEDIITVVDGRPELIDEVLVSSGQLRQFVASEFGKLLDTPGFLDALPGMLLDVGEKRATEVAHRLRLLARLSAR